MKKVLQKYVSKVEEFLSILWLCRILGSHDNTTPFKERGNKPDPEMIDKIGVWQAWVLDNRMYCKRCGHVPDVTKRFIARCIAMDAEDKTEKEKIVSSLVQEITTPPFEKY